MSDTTLNSFVASGTAAERAAFTPAPPTPAAGPDNGYFWFETDTGLTYSWDGAVWVLTGGGGSTIPATVQGDLLYATAANTLAALAKNTNATRYLSNTGATNNPAWAQVALATGVSGDLPFANLTQGSALSVLGVTGNATADNASIVAASDFQVLRRSGTAVAFGSVNLASSNAVTGVLPVANGGTGSASGATILSSGVVTVTNAEYLTLPTAAKTIIANPGSGFRINLINAYLLADFSLGLYTGAAAISWLNLRLGTALGSSFIANDNTASVPFAFLTTFNDATKKTAILVPNQDTSDVSAGWGLLSTPITATTGDNLALVLKADNGGVDFGGGNAGNTLKVVVYYTIEATS